MDDNKEQKAQEETPQTPEPGNIRDAVASALEGDNPEDVILEVKEEVVTPTPEVVPPVEIPIVEPIAPPPPPIDEEKLSDSIVDKILKANKEEKTPEEQDALTVALTEITNKAKLEGREVTYEEALKVVSEVATKKAKDEIMAELQNEADEEERKEIEQRTQVEEAQKKVNDQWNTYWDGQLAELEALGKIPKIVTPGDEKDPGVKARLELFGKMKEVSDQYKKDGKEPILNLKEIYAFHYQPANAVIEEQKNAPVAGVTRSVTDTKTTVDDLMEKPLSLREAVEAVNALNSE